MVRLSGFTRTNAKRFRSPIALVSTTGLERISTRRGGVVTPRRKTSRGMGSGPKKAQQRNTFAASGDRCSTWVTDSRQAAIMESGYSVDLLSDSTSRVLSASISR